MCITPEMSDASAAGTAKAPEPVTSKPKRNGTSIMAQRYDITDPDELIRRIEQDRRWLQQQLAHIPVPAGALRCSEWSATRRYLDDATRIIEWSNHDVDLAGIAIEGFQDSTGAVRNFVTINVEAEEMDSKTARAIAAAIVKAADALDALR